MKTALRCVVWMFAGLGLATATVPQCVLAEDAAPAARPDPDEATRELGRRIWHILEVIEQRHIRAPSREQLMGCILQFLNTDVPQSGKIESADPLLAAVTADEFADRFLKSWNRSVSRWPSADPFLTAVLEAMTQATGSPMHLVKAKDYDVEVQLQNNRYVGLGVNINKGDPNSPPLFSRVMPGGAAERGGLADGVAVLEVDGRSTVGVELMQVVDWIRGPKGSQVTLKVRQHGAQRDEDVTLTRDVVRIDSVKGLQSTPLYRSKSLRYLGEAEPIGYLEISGITGSTVHELRQAELRVRQEDIQVLVLDFRGSGSSNFHQARLLADALLDGGKIWTRLERGAEPVAEVADRECLFRDVPLVAILNPSSGSADIMVAAALQDAGRAVIVGNPNAFDGSIRSAVPLPGGQHLLMLDTAMLIRSRSDMSWPLQPNYIVHPYEPIIVLEGQVSALAPDNLEFLVQRYREPIPRRDAFSSVRRPNNPVFEASRIARELLKARTSG